MANIKREIQKKYGVDIDEEKILVMYKIAKKPEITSEELEDAIAKTRNRLEKSASNFNQPEEITQQSKTRLEKANIYEEILRNNDLRKQLFDYYGENVGNVKGVAFAKDYFSLISTSKKIRQSDVDFFFAYYDKCNRDIRKGKSDIAKMLKKEYGLSEKENKDEDKDLKDNSRDKRIHNLFSKETILAVRRLLDEYEEASQKIQGCPTSLYEYLDLGHKKSLDELASFVNERNDELYRKAYDNRGADDALRNPLNAVLEICKRKDVIDNFPEFKMLIKYPDLTPYMYAITEPGKDTIDGISDIACNTYDFVNAGDFIITYYSKMADNFNINNSRINSILKKAKKNAGRNKVVRSLNGKMGLGARILYFIAYYPVFILYFVCEFFKVLFSKLAVAKIPLFIAITALWTWFILSAASVALGEFPDFTARATWWAIIDSCSINEIKDGNSMMYALLQTAAVLIVSLGGPGLFGAKIISTFVTMFNKTFDFTGLERTISEGIFKTARKNIEAHEKKEKGSGAKTLIPRAAGSVVNTIIATILITLAIRMF